MPNLPTKDEYDVAIIERWLKLVGEEPSEFFEPDIPAITAELLPVLEARIGNVDCSLVLQVGTQRQSVSPEDHDTALATVHAAKRAILRKVDYSFNPLPDQGQGDSTISIGDLITLADVSNTSLGIYARKAGVNTPGRGEQNFQFPINDARRILSAMMASPQKTTKAKAKKALEQLA